MSEQNPETQEGQKLSDVLAKQDEEQQSQAKPADEAHKCSICGGPDHRGCGCEARAEKESPPTPPNEKNDQAVLPFIQLLGEAVQEPKFQEAVSAVAETMTAFGSQLQTVADILNSIDSNTRDLIELEKERRNLVKDLQNGSQN